MTIKTHGRMMTDNTVGIPQLAVTDGSAGQAIVTDGEIGRASCRERV